MLAEKNSVENQQEKPQVDRVRDVRDVWRIQKERDKTTGLAREKRRVIARKKQLEWKTRLAVKLEDKDTQLKGYLGL